MVSSFLSCRLIGVKGHWASLLVVSHYNVYFVMHLDVAYVSYVTCQLESMDLLSIAGSTSSSALQSIIPPRPWNVQNDGKSLLVGRFGKLLLLQN